MAIERPNLNTPAQLLWRSKDTPTRGVATTTSPKSTLATHPYVEVNYPTAPDELIIAEGAVIEDVVRVSLMEQFLTLPNLSAARTQTPSQLIFNSPINNLIEMWDIKGFGKPSIRGVRSNRHCYAEVICKGVRRLSTPVQVRALVWDGRYLTWDGRILEF